MHPTHIRITLPHPLPCAIQEGADAEIVAAEHRNRLVSKLHSILKPFVLRRLKSDVNIALPEKAEVLLYAHMTKDQKKLNQQV